MPLPLSSVVSVTVNLQSPGITRQGFGVPLLLSNTGNAWATPELTRTYTKDSYATDFPSTTPEYAALAALFSQPAPPKNVMVGKGPNKPTETVTVTVQTATSGVVYTLNVSCNGTLWSAKYTAQPGDTTTNIAAGLVVKLTPAAWQALTAYSVGDRVLNDSGKLYECTVAGTSAGAGGPTGTGAAIVDATVTWKYVVTPNFTAANVGAVITATGSAAGKWFALEPLAGGDPAAVSDLMTMADTTADPGVATDLTAILGADASWYALLLLFKSSAILSTPTTGAGPWAQANSRLLVASVADTACATSTFAAGSDVLKTLTNQGASYVAAQWHPRGYEFLDACTIGYFIGLEPGSDNWRFKVLTGPTPVHLTATQVDNLDDRRAGYFSELGGRNVLAGGGYVESATFGFIDVRRNVDWYTANLQADLIDLEIKTSKLFNTTGGRRKIATAISSRNETGIRKGVISPEALDPDNDVQEAYTVTVPPVSDTSSFDPATRALSGVSTTWRIAHAINSMAVTVNVVQ